MNARNEELNEGFLLPPSMVFERPAGTLFEQGTGTEATQQRWTQWQRENEYRQQWRQQQQTVDSAQYTANWNTMHPDPIPWVSLPSLDGILNQAPNQVGEGPPPPHAERSSLLDDHTARGQLNSLHNMNHMLSMLRQERHDNLAPAAETTSSLAAENHSFIDAIHSTNGIIRQERVRAAQAKN